MHSLAQHRGYGPRVLLWRKHYTVPGGSIVCPSSRERVNPAAEPSRPTSFWSGPRRWEDADFDQRAVLH